MSDRRYRSVVTLACAAALSCAGGTGDSVGETMTDASSGSKSGSATETMTEGGSASTGATTGTSGGSESGTGGSTDATEATTETTETTETTATTDGVECELEAVACAQAEIGGELFIDCGIVYPMESTPEEWQTARECALAAVADEKAFKLVTWLQGIDSEVGYAYVGFEGESYGISRYLFDSYPPAGIVVNPCTSLTAEASCISAVGQVCLTCVDAGPNSKVCGGR